MSKRKAKTATAKLLAFASPTALLKSIRLDKEIHGAEAGELLEKKLMDSGGCAVYPNQPFKYGFKMICTNKKHLIENPIGVRSPLTHKQLKMVAKFVGLAALKRCKSDTEYLRKLKILLVQKCNVQNPNELNWADILAHIEAFLSKTEQKTKIGDKTKNAQNEPLSKRTLAVLKLLENLPPNQALTGRQIIDELFKINILLDQSTLTKYIIPALKPHGVKNKPRVGYYIEKSS